MTGELQPAGVAAAASVEPADPDQHDPDQHDPDQHGPDTERPQHRQQRDWAWVEEYRAGAEPTPWAPGMVLALFTGLVVAAAVYVLSAGLVDTPLLAVLVNVLVAAGLGPAVWLSRGLPVLRWVAGGAVLGILAAWLAALVFLV